MITINVEDKIWEELNKMKKPGETFNKVIERIINNQKEGNNGNTNNN